MSLIIIGKKSASLDTDVNLFFENEQYKVGIRQFGRKIYLQRSLGRFQLYSSLPVTKGQNGTLRKMADLTQVPFLKTLLPVLENELLGFDGVAEQDGFRLCLNSVKYSRARWYYVFFNDSLIFSDDLRELLPYSKRKINSEILFGILKYGETPEYYSAISDIHAIPASNFLELHPGILDSFFRAREIPLSAFQFYHKMKYSFEGGDIKETESLLTNISQQIADDKPDIFISGGIDSTLLNCLYDQQTSSKYNAHYIYFGEEDREINYAKWAVKDTKADLHIWQMTCNDFVPSMEAAAKVLIQPVIDNTGSVFVGSCFKQKLGTSQMGAIIDGTAADSCYGSKDYSKPVHRGNPKPYWLLQASEYVSSVLRLYQLPLHRKFIPRDSFDDDNNLLELQWYLGPFGNVFFRNSKQYTKDLSKKYKGYYDLLDAKGFNDEYAHYTILKLALYASKQTTVKVYDIHPNTEIIFPFLYSSVLKDQAKYTWLEKSTNNIVKYPLKKILENYISSDFIYRRKVGLNNQNTIWFDSPEVRNYLISVFRNSDLKEIIFPIGFKEICKALDRKNVHLDIKKLVLAFTTMDLWMKQNKVSLC